ncbi:MAG: AMP-binding protein [Candidatus Methanofastidiosia archaeon]
MKDQLISLLQTALKSKGYQKKYKNINIGEAIEDTSKIPLLEYHEILSSPFDFLTSPLSAAHYVYFSSGTLGKPKTLFYSAKDIERVAYQCTRFSMIEGISNSDTVLLLLPMSLWITGAITRLGHIGAGACVVPLSLSGSMNTWTHIASLIDYTCISSTPSVLMDFAPQAPQKDIRIVETTGEPLPDSVRKTIEHKYKGEVYDAYGLTEAVVGVECSEHKGFHYFGDSTIVEVIDPESGAVLDEGETGEIVVTSFLQHLMPIIRFRTGDLGYVSATPCDCGLRYPRVWVKGRSHLTINLPAAVKLYPYQILEAILSIEGLLPDYEVMVTEKKGIHRLLFRIEADGPVDQKEAEENLESLSLDIVDLVNSGKVEIDLDIVEKGVLSEDSTKHVSRIIDKREQY